MDDGTEMDKRVDRMVRELRKEHHKCTRTYRNIVFAGGGLKGLMYLGGWQAIVNSGGIGRIKRMVGTSAGAIVIMLLVAGFHPMELVMFMKNLDFPNLLKIDLSQFWESYSVNSGDRLWYVLKRLIESKQHITAETTMLEYFHKTGIRLVFVATDMCGCEPAYLSYETFPDLSILTAARMSSAIPGFFAPVEYNDRLYVDGGCVDNFPIQQIPEDEHDSTICFCPDSGLCYPNRIGSIEDYLERMYRAISSASVKTKLIRYRNIIVPFDHSIHRLSTLSLSKTISELLDVYDETYNQTIKFLRQRDANTGSNN